MITQSVMPLKRMERAIQKGYQCGDCGNLLTLAWGGKYGVNEDVLMCPGHPEHHTMAREAALSTWDTPDEYNPFSYTLKRRRREKLVTKYGEEAGQALAPYAGRTNLSPVEAREIIMTMFPGAPELEVKKAVWICVQQRLNPLMKHLFLIPFKKRKEVNGKWVDADPEWAVIMAIKASRIRGMRAGGITYLDDSPRIMTEAEQKKIRGYVDTVNDWYICRGRNVKNNEAPGYGCWPKGKAAQGTDKGNTDSNMGMIRAERQMIDRLYPDDADDDVGVTDGRYASVRGQIIDLGTGEIVEGSRAPELAEPPVDSEEPPPEDGQTPPPEGSTPPEKAPTPEIKTLGDLFTRANKELHLSQSQVLAKLGLSSKDLIGDLGEAWQRLTA